MHHRSTDTRRIDFKENKNGVSMFTNFSYLPRKMTWKGKTAMNSDQMVVEKDKRIGKLKEKRGGKE